MKGAIIMDQNLELLNDVYENAEMGRDTIKRLIKITEDDEFRKTMAYQFAEYQSVMDEARRIFISVGQSPRGIKGIAKSSVNASIAINTAIDKTSTHLAEMIMQGCTMGIIDMIKSIKHNPDASEEVRTLAEKLLATEENNMNIMKEHL